MTTTAGQQVTAGAPKTAYENPGTIKHYFADGRYHVDKYQNGVRTGGHSFTYAVTALLYIDNLINNHCYVLETAVQS